MQSFLHAIGEHLTPILKDSKFKETGVLTPEEFVAAGDFLCYKCPTWTWNAGVEGKRRPFLPLKKQFLVTKNVPCLRRVKQIEADGTESGGEELLLDDGWIATHVNANNNNNADGNLSGSRNGSPVTTVNIIEDEKQASGSTDLLAAPVSSVAAQPKLIGTSLLRSSSPISTHSHSSGDLSNTSSVGNMDDIPDIMDYDNPDNLVEDDPALLTTAHFSSSSPVSSASGDNILRTRTYDLSITYDKYYQTPRIWLFGYDENGASLKPSSVFQDISQDHAKKTVTIETHPHLNLSCASIHPCKHSNVMKKLIDHLVENGKDLRVDQYLVLFLKFMSSVLPTIDYDYTMSMEG